MTINWISVQLLRKDYSRVEARCVSQQRRVGENQYKHSHPGIRPPNRPENDAQRQTNR
jgi:hypothetical protein